MTFTLTSDRPLVTILADQARSTVTGKHRARFLHAMTTAEFLKAQPGDAGFALMATAKGRHIGQTRFEVDADRIELVGRAGSLAAVLDGLKKHRIADDVKWTEPAPDAIVAVYGEHAAAVAARVLELPALKDTGFADVSWSGASVRVTRIAAIASELARATVHLRLPAALAPSLRVRLLSAGCEPLEAADWERLRIEAGWPLDGVDLGHDDVALASERLAANVSWTKGCFLGQEVYVMARDRGELPKRLRGVVVPGAVAPAAHAELFQAPVDVAQQLSKEAERPALGQVGSAAPVGSGYLALAMLKRKAAEPGTELALADGRRVRVVALPGA